MIGQLSADYFEDRETAQVVAELDASVRQDAQHPTALLCAEHLRVRDTMHRRITLRFPIFESQPGSDRSETRKIVLTGALGFDAEEILQQINNLPTFGAEGLRASQLPQDQHRAIETSEQFNSDSLLQAFIHSMPAIATVKDASGVLRCYNEMYSTVTGKDDALGKTPIQNWGEELGRGIAIHDRFVRRNEEYRI